MTSGASVKMFTTLKSVFRFFLVFVEVTDLLNWGNLITCLYFLLASGGRAARCSAASVCKQTGSAKCHGNQWNDR